MSEIWVSECPSCASKKFAESQLAKSVGVDGVKECGFCGCLYVKGISYEDSCKIVLPYWHKGQSLFDCWFDFLYTDSEGNLKRRHGLFDVNSRRITQVG